MSLNILSTGDGTISRDELRLVIGACVSESELKLDDSQLHMLVDVLIKAVDKDGDGVITFEELSEQFGQYPELVANLSIRSVFSTANLALIDIPRTSGEDNRVCL